MLLTTWGSTGDIAPYTGVAAALTAAGHQVTVVVSSRYTNRFTMHAAHVHALPTEKQEDVLLARKRAHPRLWQHIPTTAAPVLLRTSAEADLILANPLMHPLCAVIGEGLNVPSVGVYTIALGMILPRLAAGHAANGYALADKAAKLALSHMFAPAVRYLRHSLGLPLRRTETLLRTLRDQQICYGMSEALIPAGFPHTTTGHWTPCRPDGWQPGRRLLDFLERGPAPVYFGFGSMYRTDTAKLNQIIEETVRILGVRAVIQAGWGGLHAETDDILTIGECPHDWLFPRMRAAVHHAGVGTVHASLSAGIPTLPVPVMLDQPYWAGRLHTLGLTPAVIPARHLTAERLEHSLSRLLHQDMYTERILKFRDRAQKQDGTGNLLTEINRYL
ncbi:glycosyltransferase [Amycolatopsis sp. PS_44_ISF1]|uniref:glycosyltransferase n=1 Tax=Amycolatopsis sp. PS_44_ISF1 TaxID=2974917 RepID=UPI0028DF4613|nr:glycosyltransferase [Amycolatopsis sp. PS_44_ISF1]MDT8913704.1 glycosyltransferase [Amycolatopsis sp. PS_44_ISF1]